MSAQNSAGIHTLLEAEKEAQKIIQKARECKTRRVKEARIEAQNEIEGYRKQKEEEFYEFEAKHSSGNKKDEENANKEAEGILDDIKHAGSESGSRVVEELLKMVTSIN